MRSAADSHARTFRSPASAPECPPPVQDSTGNWCEPSAWLDRESRCWRTWQRCFLTGWEPFLATWPRAGIVWNGIAYRRAPSAPRTSGTGSGLLPTPTAGDDALARRANCNLDDQFVTSTGTIRVRRPDGHSTNLGLPPMLPTPTTQGNDLSPSMGKWPRHRAMAELAGLPPPRASDADKGGRGDLLTVLRGYETKHAGTLPTPTARDWRSGKASEETHSKNSSPLNETVTAMGGNRSGRMNPRFREWMMGLPIGWTELKPPETDSSRKSPS